MDHIRHDGVLIQHEQFVGVKGFVDGNKILLSTDLHYWRGKKYIIDTTDSSLTRSGNPT
jgi:hypothetical protein